MELTPKKKASSPEEKLGSVRQMPVVDTTTILKFEKRQSPSKIDRNWTDDYRHRFPWSRIGRDFSVSTMHHESAFLEASVAFIFASYLFRRSLRYHRKFFSKIGSLALRVLYQDRLAAAERQSKFGMRAIQKMFIHQVRFRYGSNFAIPRLQKTTLHLYSFNAKLAIPLYPGNFNDRQGFYLVPSSNIGKVVAIGYMSFTVKQSASFTLNILPG
ncbi:hypothetical protein GcC1_184014 [Golovinomyces cichoracearum]|uniref:Uncharacterized protein n=1 Tax=Golovinomyces cichoracearum TaxID=62708 RepID=A0A420HLE0_9PEZI|nr:hypothetical protein GcC1_184014 [Golovinomyces cichoracearum]